MLRTTSVEPPWEPIPEPAPEPPLPEPPRRPGPPGHPKPPGRPDIGRVVPLSGDRGPSPFERLLQRRIVFLRGEMDDDVASETIAWLLSLDGDADEDIHLYLDSPGGTMTGMFAVHDTIQALRSTVHTRVVGAAAGAAAFLLATGTGLRAATPNARIRLCQPPGEFQGSASDLVAHARQWEHLRERMESILAARTGRSPEQIRDDLDRGRWLSAEEARADGVVDEIVATR